MKDYQLIEKAKKVLDSIGINYSDCKISIDRIENEILNSEMEEFENEYSICFSSNLPDGRLSKFFVTFHKITNKLINVITKSNMYEVPEELR